MRSSEITVAILLRLKQQYGDLNRALVMEYIKAFGTTSERKLAQDLGVSRSVIRRALQDWSDSDRPICNLSE
jgi:DNA-binding FadR family transcriptional regulator